RDRRSRHAVDHESLRPDSRPELWKDDWRRHSRADSQRAGRNRSLSGRRGSRVTLLYLSQVNVFYGANHAVRDLDLQVEQGEIVGLIGANGAGKSTTMMSIMGAVKPRS